MGVHYNALNVGNDGVCVCEIMANVGNDCLSVRDVTENVGNDHTCVYPKFDLEADSW